MGQIKNIKLHIVTDIKNKLKKSLTLSFMAATTPVNPNAPVTKAADTTPGGGGGDTKSVQDLTVFVENLLGSMQEKFQTMSDQILSRMDEMGNRIDELEKNIDDLMQQAGIEESASPIDK